MGGGRPWGLPGLAACSCTAEARLWAGQALRVAQTQAWCAGRQPEGARPPSAAAEGRTCRRRAEKGTSRCAPAGWQSALPARGPLARTPAHATHECLTVLRPQPCLPVRCHVRARARESPHAKGQNGNGGNADTQVLGETGNFVERFTGCCMGRAVLHSRYTLPVGPVTASSPSCRIQNTSAASSMSHSAMPAGTCEAAQARQQACAAAAQQPRQPAQQAGSGSSCSAVSPRADAVDAGSQHALVSNMGGLACRGVIMPATALCMAGGQSWNSPSRMNRGRLICAASPLVSPVLAHTCLVQQPHLALPPHTHSHACRAPLHASADSACGFNVRSRPPC